MTETAGTTCPNCGAVMPDDSEACSHCGTLLVDVSYPGAVPPAANEGRVVSVTRTVTANIDLRLPQEAVDQQHWLTPEQWQRLLDTYETQLATAMEAELASGRTSDIAAISATTPVPWEGVGDQLSSSQRTAIEAGLRRLFAGLPAATTMRRPVAGPPRVIPQPPRRRCLTLGCGVLLLAGGLLGYLLSQ